MSSLLLDTHVWVWYVTGDDGLKKPLRKLINTAASDNQLYLAAISLWEISMLEIKKRIILEMPCLEWLNKGIDLTNTRILPLTPSVAVESCHLPGKFHGDPSDRIIVAAARVEALNLVTRDAGILAYSRHKYISVTKA